MPSVVDSESPLHDALESLERASQTPAKQRTVKVSEVVDAICSQAFDHGLQQDELRQIIYIISNKTELDQTSVTTLIKNLYPAQSIPANVIITVVGALGQGRGKPTPGTQNNLVKWLAIVHEVLEDPAVLSRLYGVLFGMLDMISIRTSLCHLLSLITRRKHVKPFRIQYLLDFSRSLGNEPALQGLLRIYKDYYPDILLGSTSTSRNSFAPQPDVEWRTRLLAIQDRDAAATDTTGQHNGFRVLRKAPQHIKNRIIPDVHTFYTNEASVTLEGIDNVDDFVGKLDKIDPPGQLISFLTDPLLQKYVNLKPSPILERRIELWLSNCLEEHYNDTKEGTIDSISLSEILDGLLKHAQYTKKLMPIVETFLREYLTIWDGLNDLETLLSLVSYIPIQPFQSAYTAFLQSVERALTTQNTSGHSQLLHFYTDLFRQWSIRASPQAKKPHSAFAGSDQTSLKDLVSHVSHLSTSLLLALPIGHETQITSTILSFFELVATSSTPHRIPILLLPTPLISLLVLTPSTTTLSRTTGLIATYKHAFNVHPTPVRDYYPTSLIDTFNVLIRDVYNLIWISRALSIAKDDAGRDKAIGLHCAPTLREGLAGYLNADFDREYALAPAFGLSYNPQTAALAAGVWDTIQDAELRRLYGGDGESEDAERHLGPVSQRSLDVLRKRGGVDIEWERYRVEVLRWLEARGLAGIKEFLWASSESLKKKYGN
ncbi:unnamed protein product [Periconia digitata]|uniref:Mis6 domain protein n=1 Tax=Periconia digitata TaxID=1303443 RepID=A0A9W4U9Y0_9PLEO|nr:unnamed protein product [Periconia digitata]